MKKKGILVVFLFMLGMFFGFGRVNAEEVGLIFGSTDEAMSKTMLNGDETRSNGSISIENKGAESEAFLGVKALKDIPSGTSFGAVINLRNSEWKYLDYDSASYSSSGWNVTITKVSDVQANLTATATTNMSAGQKVVIAKLKLDGSGATGSTTSCRITLATAEPQPETPKCQKDGDTYYCQNGQVCTEAEYKELCPTTTENPQTGSFIPYAVIILGIAVAGGLYFLTKKNKIYHI